MPLWFSALLGLESICSCFGGQLAGPTFSRGPGWGSPPAAPVRAGLGLPRPLPANLPPPPGPARCPSSGGGGRGGGGNSGAGTALEGVGAGQLRWDGEPRLCPQKVPCGKRGAARDGVLGPRVGPGPQPGSRPLWGQTGHALPHPAPGVTRAGTPRSRDHFFYHSPVQGSPFPLSPHPPLPARVAAST